MLCGNRKSVRNAFPALLALGSLVLSARAEVTGITANGYMRSGRTGATTMMIVSPESVDGLNGEFTFDANLFSNPGINIDNGSQGFTALGNEVAPGVFRFILYKNPANQPLNQDLPVLRFYLTPAPNLVHSTMSTVNYTMSAAARVVVGEGGAASAVSIQPTTFQSFTVFVNGAATKNWELYE